MELRNQEPRSRGAEQANQGTAGELVVTAAKILINPRAEEPRG